MFDVMLLHPTTELSWTSFDVHWSTVIGIAALAGLYVWRARAGERAMTAAEGGVERRVPAAVAHPPLTAGRKVLFLLGLATLFFTLNGPIHDLSDSYLFSAHMVQHLLLTMLVTPLLIAGTPGWMLRPALRSRAVAAIARRITTGPAAFAIFNLTIVVWHLPPLYNYALAHHPVHIVQHLCFLVASTIMWWPIMSTMPELPRLSYPKQMLYVFLMTMPMSLVAIIITYSDSLLYPFYASAPRVLGLSPLQDQRLGGLIMWIPGGLIFAGVLSVIFFKWVGELEAQDRREATA
ncbi:MAG TPA: cytochrome c oxidase assembly protein [Gemmatimonadaceae bacterium]|nr:cytochrome c oxidase assembly protein [Gemmatimonadaceae bacterium]